LAQRAGDSVELMSKNGQPLARYFPEIVSALAHLPDGDFVLDGELVVPLAGALSFDALQQRIHPAASRVALLARTTPARYLIFDLLGRNGESIAGLPLRERRRELERFAAAFGAGPELRLSPAAADRRTVDAWFARVGGALDGVVAKRLDLGGFRYAANDRARVGSLRAQVVCCWGCTTAQAGLTTSAFAARSRRPNARRCSNAWSDMKGEADLPAARRRYALALGPRCGARSIVCRAATGTGARSRLRSGDGRAHPARHTAPTLAQRQIAVGVHGRPVGSRRQRAGFAGLLSLS
jgi:hypothetical protein